MSAPSFSSFPPSFGSFPDLDRKAEVASSSGHQEKEGERREEHSKKVKHRDRDRRSDKRDRNSRKNKGGSRHKEKKLARGLNDEQLKSEEDRHARLGATYDGGAPGLFIIDKVGDPMNVVYGGLHAGDIPKYRRMGCKLFLLSFE